MVSQMIKPSPKSSGKKFSLARPPILLGLGVSGLGLALHSIQLYKEIQHLNWVAENRIMVDPYPIWTQIHALFIVGFLLSLVGLLPRVRLGLIVSILSLMFVLLVYARWYAYSYLVLKVIRESEYAIHPDAIPLRPLGLVDANWLDITILIAVVIVLAWQIKFLISSFRPRRARSDQLSTVEEESD